MSIIRIVMRLWRALVDRCEFCGGRVYAWRAGKAYCEVCGRRN